MTDLVQAGLWVLGVAVLWVFVCVVGYHRDRLKAADRRVEVLEDALRAVAVLAPEIKAMYPVAFKWDDPTGLRLYSLREDARVLGAVEVSAKTKAEAKRIRARLDRARKEAQ